MKFLSTMSIALVAILGYAGMSSFTTKSSEQLFNGYYDAQFVSSVQSGAHYEWTWSVTNPNPGNGKNGTLQDLSHWSIAVPDFVMMEHIVSVEYSKDNVTWIPLEVNLGTDKSLACYDGKVVKFDVGTSGSETTYYRLTVNTEFSTNYTTAVFKSGKQTGCSTTAVAGIGEAEDSGPIRE